MLEPILTVASTAVLAAAAAVALGWTREECRRRPGYLVAAAILLIALWQLGLLLGTGLVGSGGEAWAEKGPGLAFSLFLLGGVVWARRPIPGARAIPRMEDHDSTEKRLNSILETLPVLLVSADGKTGEYLFFQGAVRELVGHAPEEFFQDMRLGNRMLHPADRQRMIETYARGLASKKPFEADCRVIHGEDGRAVWFHARVVPILTSDGSLLRHDTVAFDVTARKEAEEVLRKHQQQLQDLVEERTVELKKLNVQLQREIHERRQTEAALRESQERLRSVIESAPNYVLTVDRTGTIRFVNRTVAGLRPEDVIGKTIYSLTLPEYREVMRTTLEEALEGTGPASCETVGVGPNGEPARYENHFGAIVGEEGIQAATIVAIDITDRKEAEESLRRSEAQLRTAMESLPFDFFVIGKDGRYVMQNATTRKHWGDVVGKYPREVASNEATRALWEENNRRAFSGEVVKEEVSFELGGETRCFYNIISPVCVEDRIVSVLGVNIDITERKLAEEAIRQRETLYRTLFELSPSGILLEDRNGNVLDVNPALAGTLGYSQGEFRGRNVRQITPDPPEQVAEHIERILSGETLSHVVRSTRRDGAVRFMELRETRIQTPAGDDGILVIANDITERRRAEEGLRRSMERYRGVFDTSPLAIMVWDRNRRVTDWNPTAEQLLGWSADEVTGRDFAEFLVPPGHGQKVEAEVAEVFERKVVRHRVHRCLKKEGGTLVFDWNSSVLHDSHGEIVGAISVGLDITEQVEAEAKVRRREQVYREAIEAASGVPYFLRFGGSGRERHYEFMGEGIRDLLGLEPGELTPGRLDAITEASTVTDPEGPQEVRELSALFRAGEVKRWWTDVRVRTPAGQLKWISDSAIPIRDEITGAVVGSLGIMQDITDRKRIEEKLRQSEESERCLRERLATLVEVGNTLSTAESVNDLCRMAVGLGRERLGFDRLGIWLVEEDGRSARGTFGTDEHGATRDERGSRLSLFEGAGQIFRRGALHQAVMEENAALHDDHGREVGTGTRMFSPLWDGRAVIGYLSADNLLSGRPITEHDAEILAALASTLGHLAARAHALAAVRASEEMYRRAIEAAAGVPFRVRWRQPNVGTQFESVGEGVKTLFGIPSEELTPTRFSDTIEAAFPVDASGWRDIGEYEQAFRNGKIERYQADYRVRTPHGEVKWLNSSAVPIRREASGEVIGALGIMQDVTERREKEELLRVQNEHLAIMNEVARVTTGSLTPEEMCERLLEVVRKHLPCDAFILDRFYPETGETLCIRTYDTIDGRIQEVEAPEVPILPSGPVMEHCIRRRDVYRIHRKDPAGERPPFVMFGDTGRPSASLLFVPLISVNKVTGIMSVQSYTPNAYSDEDVDIIRAIAHQTGPSLEGAFLREELQRSEERYRSLFENCPVPLWESDISAAAAWVGKLRAEGVPDLRAYLESHPEVVSEMMARSPVLDLNAAACELAGAESKAEVQQRLDQVVTEEWRITYREAMLAFLEGGRTFVAGSSIRTLKGETKDVYVGAAVVRERDGLPTRVYVSTTDITARKQAEERIRLLSLAMEQLTEGIALSDLDGNVMFTNEVFAALHGLQRAELAGRHLSILHTPEQMAEVEGALREIREAGSFAGEIPHARRDGTVFPGLMHCSLFHSEDGRPVGMIATLVDITDIRKAERELQRQRDQLQEFTVELIAARDQAQAADRAKTTFLANLSHELKTPLNSIIGFSDRVLRKTKGMIPEQQRQNLEDILESSKHLMHVIEALLDMSSMEIGHIRLTPERFDLAALVRDTASMAKPLMRVNHNHLVVWTADDLGDVFTDPTKVRQILLNLLGNAAKFTHGGQVSLAVSRELAPEGSRTAEAGTTYEAPGAGAPRITFTVADDGIGMSPEQLALIFDAFRQADDSPSRRYGGTGLGLTISKRLAELLGGSIDVSSELGRGSTFTVRIPASVKETPPGNPSTMEEPHHEPDPGR